MTAQYQIFHNPRCSKSRQTLQLLQEKGITPEELIYLENTPSEKELAHVIGLLNMSARDLLRKGEDDYKALNLSDKTLTDAELVASMVKHPKLIERPIVIKTNVNGSQQAVIGRPPENILQLLA